MPPVSGGGANFMVKGILGILGLAVVGSAYVFSASTGIVLSDSASDNTISIKGASDEAANRTLSIGPLGGNAVLAPVQLTAGTMTVTNASEIRETVHRYDWTNAQVVALGASLTGDITVCTLPAKTIVKNVYVVITGTAAGVATLTVAAGRVSAAYIDYTVASDAKVAANTVYGDVSGERGTNLVGYDVPSWTATTAVKVHFISTVQTLDATTGSTGSVYIETVVLP